MSFVMAGCGTCGRWSRWALAAIVPDSSCVDGSRRVSACSPEHLVHLRQSYAARPWAIEETWLARIRLTVQGADRPMCDDELAAAIGLHRDQVDQALRWNRARVRQRLQEMAALVPVDRRQPHHRRVAAGHPACRVAVR